ncbi:hypothetical protein GQ457_14G008070 [Hibiscus cannabinus]
MSLGLKAYAQVEGKSLWSVVMRLAWNCYIVSIWKERNQRLFQNHEASIMEIAEQIREIIRFKLFGMCLHQMGDANAALCIAWKLE